MPSTGGVAIAVNKVQGATFELTSAKTGGRQGFTDKIAAGAWASVESVSTLTISAEAQLEESVVVSVVGSGAFSYGQLDINVEKFAKAVVIVDHIGDATYAGNIDINVADGASVCVVSLQDWDRAWFTPHLVVKLNCLDFISLALANMLSIGCSLTIANLTAAAMWFTKVR